MDSGVGSLGNKTSSEEEEIKIFVSQMLTSRVFLGDFQERRFVELLNDYRDVIVIGQQHGDLLRDMDVVRKRLDKYYNGRVWIGITGPKMIGTPSGHCLWVNLQDQPLGQFWFIINKVKFLHNEIIIKLKKIRMPSSASNPTSEQASQSENSFSELLGFLTELDVKSTIEASVSQCIPILRSIFTYHNTKQTFLFLSVLFLAIVTLLLNCLRYLAEYSVRFLREFNGFIHAITPFMLGVLDLISKIIGGAYILLAMMWRGNSAPPVGLQNLKMMNQHNQQICLPPASPKFKTYADFRQKYQNHDGHWSSAYSRQMK